MKDRDARLVKHMVELMRDIGGATEFINTSRHLGGFIEAAHEALETRRKPVSRASVSRKTRDAVQEQRRKRM
jgi:hypothetical protein